MKERQRIHIIPIGFDSTRATEPLIQLKADKAYFLRYTGDRKSSVYFDFIKSELKNKLNQLEIEERFLDIWNLYECIQIVRKIILEEKKKENLVFVNVSTGSKINAIAGMLSCMLWDAIPYYVQVNYPKQTQKTIQKLDVKGFDELPVYEISKPKLAYLKILSILENNNLAMKKSDLIKELEKIEIIKQKENLDSEFRIHAKYSQLHSILKPMENDWGFVKTESMGKRSKIIATEQGINALKIFGCD